MLSILTDFSYFDEAYSLCRVVMNQSKMLKIAKIQHQIIAKSGFSDTAKGFLKCPIVEISGVSSSNRVHVTDQSGVEIDILTADLFDVLSSSDVIVTHDLIYQPALWQYHVAARRFAKKNPKIKWLHWVHSATDMNTVYQMGDFSREVKAKWHNARLVAFHDTEKTFKANMYGYDPDKVVTIPNPVNILEHLSSEASSAICKGKMVEADITAVFPSRCGS